MSWLKKRRRSRSSSLPRSKEGLQLVVHVGKLKTKYPQRSGVWAHFGPLYTKDKGTDVVVDEEHYWCKHCVEKHCESNRASLMAKYSLRTSTGTMLDTGCSFGASWGYVFFYGIDNQQQEELPVPPQGQWFDFRSWQLRSLFLITFPFSLPRSFFYDASYFCWFCSLLFFSSSSEPRRLLVF